MKKSIIILFLAALFGAISLYAADNGRNLTSDNGNAIMLESDTNTDSSYDPLCGYWTGMIGAYQAELSMCNGKGDVYMHGSGSRTVRLKSYKGGKLVLSAYLKGKYIGYYSGTLDRSQNYYGTFYNTNGGKVNFSFQLSGAYD